MFKRIDHIAIKVKNLEKSVHFYETYFGFHKYFEHTVPSPLIQKIAYLKLGDSILELIHVLENENINNQDFHFCLESSDFDKDFNTLKNAQIKIDTFPHKTEAREKKEERWQRAVFIGLDQERIEIRG